MITELRINKRVLIVGLVSLILLITVLGIGQVTRAGVVSIHPNFALLDAEGINVLDSGEPVSSTETCGQCHDTTFITEHNSHADVLSGALIAPSGEALLIDAESGTTTLLDKVVDSEANCFVCHLDQANNEARLDALASGQIAWANTATLLNIGVVEQSNAGYVWNTDSFNEDGMVRDGLIHVQDPTVENCGNCHGQTTSTVIDPLTFDACDPTGRTTFTTGEIFAPGRIMESGVNVANKDELDRSWDVHAERVVSCTDCHYSLNNPVYGGITESELDHLDFDPRQFELGEYLEQPNHTLANSSDASDITGCTSCHNALGTHDFLPYVERHNSAVACETCHIPRLEAPAAQSIDWTVITETGAPSTVCRGEEVSGPDQPSLITGYEPVLLQNKAGQIAPYNLITSWYWISGADETPVPLAAVQKVYLDETGYAPTIVSAFDTDDDGLIDEAELTLDSDEKIAVIAERLAELGYSDATITGRVEAEAVHHSVADSDFATRDCETCHDDDSALTTPMVVSGSTPGGILPGLDFESKGLSAGSLEVGDKGVLYFKPALTIQNGAGYVFGLSRVAVIDWIGAALFVGTLLGVMTHGGLRYFAARRNGHVDSELEEAYMYSVYERLWHWLQTASIGILLITGLIIHRPDMFGAIQFRAVTIVHNVVAVILLINALLAAFYHFASGEIRNFLPRPYGLFDQMFLQIRFYLRGIFRNEPHPFEKSPERKMNPLQQITYLGLLNVLLPLQVITGIMMWGVERWPEITARLGGLPLLAPVHTMVAWLFATFIVAHVYLTTTGPAPLTSIKGMIMGWEDIEAQAATH